MSQHVQIRLDSCACCFEPRTRYFQHLLAACCCLLELQWQADFFDRFLALFETLTFHVAYLGQSYWQQQADKAIVEFTTETPKKNVLFITKLDQ